MKMLLIIMAAALAFGAHISGAAAEPRLLANSGSTTEGVATSNRTPQRTTTIPLAQVDTTKSGETSDRTPHKGSDGAAFGEKGIGPGSKSQIQARDETYSSDKAQEEQLRAVEKAD